MPMTRKERVKIEADKELHKKFRNGDVAMRGIYYPMSYERELGKLLRSYLGITSECIETRSDQREFRTDAKNLRFLAEAYKKAEKRLREYRLDKELYRIGEKAQKWAKSSFKKAFKKTFGRELKRTVDLEPVIDRWTKETAAGIKEYALNNISKAKSGQVTVDANKTRRQAAYVSRGSMCRLNGELAKEINKSLGISKYKWVTQGDERVRPCHRALNGRVFSWNAPPSMWTLSNGVKHYTGRRCHPGEDYGCRCVAAPVLSEYKVKELCDER